MNIEKLILSKTIVDIKTSCLKRATADLLHSIHELEVHTGISCRGCPFKGTKVPKHNSCMNRIVLYYLCNGGIDMTFYMLRALSTEIADHMRLEEDPGQC